MLLVVVLLVHYLLVYFAILLFLLYQCFVNDPELTHHLQSAPATREMGVARILAYYATLDSNNDQSEIPIRLRE